MTVFFPVDNARTMDYNTNDVGYVPSNAPHYFENTGDTDLVVLELFAADEFMDVSFNQWLRRVPSEMLKAHLNIDKQMATKIPAEKLYLVQELNARELTESPAEWWSFKERKLSAGCMGRARSSTNPEEGLYA
jgi:oxalate decarboxylase/phosphoglucose isomerase-like protein (cupin superfamily)